MPRFLGLGFAFVCFAAATAAASLREVENFNRDWRFLLGDHPGAEAAAFDDAAWERIGLPHSFSIPYFAGGYQFYVGYGWYRKHFDLPPTSVGRRLFLDFDGAFQDAEIFLNGHPVGRHQGGYTGFEIEITETVRAGDNLLAVRLNNRWNPQLAPRAGEHVFSGGLYRSVWLVTTSPVHVAWYGSFVTTPSATTAIGVAKVATEVVNQSAADETCEVRTEIVDPTGAIVAMMTSTQSVAAGQTATFDQTSAAIQRPQLWSPEQPVLYRAVSTVHTRQGDVDRFETPFGFRTIAWTADQGFFLNGEHRYFRGANVHQDHAGWGDAVTAAGARRDVQLIKDAGFDFIRGSHYPHAPAFAQACDEIGVLFWSENCFWGTAGFKCPWGASAYPTDPADEAGFAASVKTSLRDMIRINRNHPSIVAWSMGNEVFFSAPEVMPKVRGLLRDLVAYTHELDPTRPAAIGGVQRGEIDRIGDVAGYNGDGARIPQYLNPGVPNVVAEYGSTMADRPGPYEPGWGDLPEVPGLDPKQPYPWRFSWRSGESIWCGFDHGSIAGRRFGGMGMVDYFRLPKRQWYWYRNEYRHIPPPQWPQPGVAAGLALTADKTTLASADGTDDAQIIVTVVDRNGHALSNCPPVTLAIVSGPGEFPTGPSITFAPDSDIAIRDGAAAIEFRSYYAGETVIRATSPGLSDATITLLTRGGPPYVAGKTPSVRPRPYHRYAEPFAPGAVVTLGRENPTRASSEAPDAASLNANDGNTWTDWRASGADSHPWWRVDLERLVTVKETMVALTADGEWHYRIEISDDGERDWKTLVDTTATVRGHREHLDPVRTEANKGRFIRVTLLSWPKGATPGLGEFEAHAIVGE